MQKKLIQVGGEYAIDARNYQSKREAPESYAKRATVTALDAPRKTYNTYSGTSTVRDGVAVRLADGTEAVVQTRSVLCAWDDAWEERRRLFGIAHEEHEARLAERNRREDAVVARLAALGVELRQHWRGQAFQLTLDEAEKLVARLPGA